MNAPIRCRLTLCAVALAALAAVEPAQAQRVRFGSPGEETTAELSLASLPDHGTLSDGLAQPSPAPAATHTITYVPVYIAQAPSEVSPVSSLASALSPSRIFGSAWDPYQVASRPASFSGMITSTPAGGNLVPQPMPRVPYYTQQPVSSTAQPYVVIPDPNCAAPVVQPNQLVVPTAPATVAPQAIVTPPPPAFTAPPPAIPTLIPPTQPLPVIANRCYAIADAIFFTRDARIGNTPITLLDQPAATESNVLLSTTDLGFGWQIGPRVTLGHEFDNFRAFEGTYFGIYDFNDSATVTGNNNLNLPGDLGLVGALDFFNADTVVVDYESQIQNGELNYLQSYGNLSWLLGFRYFFLGEKFSITSTDNMTGTSFYRINAYNNLFGGQIGARVQQSCGNWSYDLTGKAGVYGNNIRSRQTVGDFDDFTLRDVKNTGTEVAFLGELGLSGYYHLNANWALRGGYQVYWIEGVALAPNQLDYTNTADSGTTLNKTGGVFMHGAHAGLMAEW